jgi:histidine triad (HIT) family protein
MEQSLNKHADCIFCQIVRGEAPSFSLCQDEQALAFMDIFPVAPGHVLVITREHFENIFEASDDSLRAVAAMSKRLAQAIRTQLAPEGLGVFQLNGAAAGQTVFHYHQHLIPRSGGDSLQLHSRVRGNDGELLALSRKLAAAL